MELSVLPTIDAQQFFDCDLRVGTVRACRPNPKARQPAYLLEIDFGPLGRRVSSAQLTERYRPPDLLGRQVVAVINLPAKRVAGVVSQCLVLGVDGDGGLVLLAPQQPVADGQRVY